MIPSARRLAATRGEGLPHLWPVAGRVACTRGVVKGGIVHGKTVVAPTAAEAWEVLTGTPARTPTRRRRAELHVTRAGAVWACECDLGFGLVVRVLGCDPCAAIRSCRAVQRAGAQ